MKRSPWKLSPLFSPHSIAVIGASPKGGAGSIVIRNLQRLGFAGTIHPVNPKYADVLGYPCHPSLETIPGPVDCAAVLLGDKAILPILKTAHARGVKGVWAFASGFAETGEQGAAMQREIRDFCRETACSSAAPTASATPTSRTESACTALPSPAPSARAASASSPKAARCCWALGNSPRGSRVFPGSFPRETKPPSAGRLHGLPCG